ncbi:hypothetical protein [Sulfurimonas sp.]|uniref:hypothetical protein n=1 Tax=Sulfurimonas sp. TaxID=2022749 RepID=UPI003D13EDB1
MFSLRLVSVILLFSLFFLSCGGGGSSSDTSTTKTNTYSLDTDGWTDLNSFLVASDGSYSLGDPSTSFNSTRDQGSKIVFIDSTNGDNDTADVYWWDGENIVDSNGSTMNDSNTTYGTDPLHPNESAIKPFKNLNVPDSDERIVTQDGMENFDEMAGGYPDWFLFRRGTTVSSFSHYFTGGRSEAEPAVYAGYGPLSDGRVIYSPDENASGGLNGKTGSSTKARWLHHIVANFEIHSTYGYIESNIVFSANDGGAVTARLEDCYFPPMESGGIVFPPMKTTIYRTIITGRWESNASVHVQGYFTGGSDAQTTFEEVIFYKNGFHGDTLTQVDPPYDKFSRNIYQGGGAQMGHTYSNIISADGGSGGPQMRLGGTLENSLILEGYFYSSTSSNGHQNDWLINGAQSGQSAKVINNVQLVYAFPTPNDPDTNGNSDTSAQASTGYTLQGASFGALIDGNIISAAMLEDDLGTTTGKAGLSISFGVESDTNQTVSYYQKNNTISNNIVYKMGKGLSLDKNASEVKGININNNVFVCDTPIENKTTDLANTTQINVNNNRFYSSLSSTTLPTGNSFATSNTLSTSQSALNAATTEGWSDPDRTLKRYVTEELGLTLLDWTDDPYLSDADKIAHASEIYDPTGVKTFMAVATHMRQGGTDVIPSSGKPSLTGDYPWDERFTGKAVVNWIRTGFGLDSVE